MSATLTLDARSRGSSVAIAPLATFAALTAAVLAGLGLQHGGAFWSTPDGVYAITARELLHGKQLYHQVAAAQPPIVYLFGAAELAVSDGLTALRAGLELVQLVTATLVFVAVRRLTGRPWVAAAAGVLTPLLPVTVSQNGLLTPEALATPMLLGSAVVASGEQPRRAVYAAILAALAVACKLAFVLPAVAILAALPARRTALACLGSALAVLAAVGSAVFGAALWRSIVMAQLQTGTQSAHDLAGLWAQAAWNAAPFVILATVGVALRPRSRDAELVRTVIAGAVGALLLVLTISKLGSYVNVVAVAEPFLLVLGACGAAWMLEQRRPPWTFARIRIAFAAVAAFGLAQGLSLVVSPADPWLSTRPGARSGPRELLSADRVRAAAEQAEACPLSAPYPGLQLVAFTADRRVPGDQPDTFILAVRANAPFARIAAADRAVCPADVPVVDSRGDVSSLRETAG